MKILVFVEHHGDTLQRDALGVLGAAAELGEAHAVLAGKGVAALAAEAAAHGAQMVFVAEDDALAAPLPQPRVALLARIVEEHGCDAILLANSVLAADIAAGLAVRLEQGDMARATVFNRDPAAQAHAFETQGFKHLHVVDLDGAFAGKPMNVSAVERILETVGLCVQLGGGIRDMATIEGWLGKGVNRVIIGTAAVRDPALVKDAAKKYPKRVAVGLDAKNGKVAVEGWAQVSEIGIVELAHRFADAGVAAIVATDISRDGAMTGIDAGAIAGFAREVGIPAVMSVRGALSALKDGERVRVNGTNGTVSRL